MKSHLIPEPTPIDRNIRETDAARFYLLDQEQVKDTFQNSSKEENHPANEIPIRNFLRVIFAG